MQSVCVELAGFVINCIFPVGPSLFVDYFGDCFGGLLFSLCVTNKNFQQKLGRKDELR